ncbi:MAG: dephospho-CoA kinase [Paludibacteraceae bacterium]
MLIGITGGIGSGKSTIAQALRERGYAVYDTDKEAKRIIVENPMVRSQVEMLFGSQVFEGDVYRTQLVAKQVFHHPDLLAQLNHIVHPAVAFHLRQWAKEQEEGILAHPCKERGLEPKHFCFVESAILFASGLDKLCDKTVVVTAPEALRIERTIRRDYHGAPTPENIAKVKQRIAAQANEDYPTTMSLLRVENNGTKSIEQLADEVLEWAQS